MKKKDNTLAYIIIGVGALLLLSRNRATQTTQTQPRYNFQNIPPPPPPNQAAAFQMWAQTILNSYGQIAELWKPGGPFYKLSPEQVQAFQNFPYLFP